jgi:hypothetical protein
MKEIKSKIKKTKNTHSFIKLKLLIPNIEKMEDEIIN